MNYQPISVVWEITMGCNMRCKHCGSSCEDALIGELTTEEAMVACDQLKEVGVEHVTLSGGEPTTRKDWHLIAEKLSSLGIKPTMITNGWLMTDDLIDKAIEAKVTNVGISIDGVEETHDQIRKKGSFQRSMDALRRMKNKGLLSSVVTSINKENLNQLPAIFEILKKEGVKSWQVQMALPMGNFREHEKEMLIEPKDVDQVIDFAYEHYQEGIQIHFGDCIGYYNLKSGEVRKSYTKEGYSHYWQGCTAGKFSFGLLHNGDIIGCTSVRRDDLVEGNIREKSIGEIWEDPDNFAWSRTQAKEKLGGLCQKCAYGDYCLGGCPNTRLCIHDDFQAANEYCSYALAVEEEKEKIGGFDNPNDMVAMVQQLIVEGNYQLAESLLSDNMKTMGLEANIDLLNIQGFLHFMLGNFKLSKRVNEKVMELEPLNLYGMKGLGLSTYRCGEVEKGLKILEECIAKTDANFMDPYYDLAILYLEEEKTEDLKRVLKKARDLSELFYIDHEELYQHIS